MIKYALVCDRDHGFEGWFGSSEDFADQQAQGLLECPVCGAREVRKQIMAPAVVGSKDRAPAVPDKAIREVVLEALGKARAYIEANFDYVGDTFAVEARAIHEGRSEVRGIYGEATGEEVKALLEDGVDVSPLPPGPRPRSEVN